MAGELVSAMLTLTIRFVEPFVQKIGLIGEAASVVIKEAVSHSIPTNYSDAMAMKHRLISLLSGSGHRHESRRGLHARDFQEHISVSFCVRLTRVLSNLPGERWMWGVASGCLVLIAGAGVVIIGLQAEAPADRGVEHAAGPFILYIAPPAPAAMPPVLPLPVGLQIILT